MINARRSFIACDIHSRMPAAVGYMPLSSENTARTPRMSRPPARTAIQDIGPLM